MNKTNWKQFCKYLIPNMISMALMAIYVFTDAFVVGQKLGSVALGAMGICTPVITLAYAFGYLFGQGSAALYSIAIGENDPKRAKVIHTTSFISMVVFGAVITTLSLIFVKPIATFLGAKSYNMEYIMPYLIVVLAGIIPLMIEVFSQAYMNNDGHPKAAMVAAVVGVLSNVALDFLFVYGFGWGMFGAAFATVFCSILGSVIKVIFIYTGDRCHGLRLSFRCINLKYLGRILGNGVASLILQSSSAIVTFVFIFQSGRYYGEAGAVIYTVILNWTLVVVNFMIGVGQAAQPLISYSYGQGDHQSIKAYLYYSLIVTSIMGVLFFLIAFFFTKPLVMVFSNDSAELVDLIAKCFKLYVPSYLFMGISMSIGSYFQAMEKGIRSFIIMTLRGIVLPVAFAFIMPLIFDKASLWWATPVAEIVAVAISVILLFAFLIKSKQEKHLINGDL